MKKSLFLLLASAALQAGPITGPPSPATFAITIDSSTAFVSAAFTPRTVGPETVYDFTAGRSFGGVAVNVTGTFNPDPWLEWQVEMLSLNETFSTVGVAVSLGALGGPYSFVTSSLSGSLLDVNGDGGGATALSHVPVIDLLNQSALALGSDCVILGASAPNQVHSCGNFGPVTAPVVTGATPAIGFVFSTRIARNDLVTYTGLIDVNQVAAEIPEPASAVMFGAGGLLIALALASRSSPRRTR